MANAVFADPFGSYTTGFREGLRDQLAVNEQARADNQATANYQRMMQDLDLGKEQLSFLQSVNPYRIDAAKYAAATSGLEAAQGATRAGATEAFPGVVSKFWDTPHTVDPQTGNVLYTTPGGSTLTMTPEQFYQLGNTGTAPLPPVQQGRGGMDGVGYGVSDFNYFDKPGGTPPAGSVVLPGQVSEAQALPPPAAAVSPATALPPEASYWTQLGEGINSLFRGRDWTQDLPPLPPEYYGPQAATGPAPQPATQPQPAPATAMPWQLAPGQGLEALLPALRAVESTNNYALDKGPKAPSGAYQYYDRWWDNYGGYPRAAQAPAEVQDRKALEDLTRAYARYGDLSQAVGNHFYPKFARDPQTWSQPIPNNSITMQEYVDRVRKAAGTGGLPYATRR